MRGEILNRLLEEWELKNGFLDSSDLNKAQKFMKELGAEIDKISVDPPTGKKQLILYGGVGRRSPILYSGSLCNYSTNKIVKSMNIIKIRINIVFLLLKPIGKLF